MSSATLRLRVVGSYVSTFEIPWIDEACFVTLDTFLPVTRSVIYRKQKIDKWLIDRQDKINIIEY